MLEYGDVVFSNAAQNDLNKLDKIHKRGAKIVAGGIRGVSSAVLFDELWMCVCVCVSVCVCDVKCLYTLWMCVCVCV